MYAYLGLVHSFPLILSTLFMLQGYKILSCYTSDVQRNCSSPDSHQLIRGKLYFSYICFKIWCDWKVLIVSKVSRILRLKETTQFSEILRPLHRISQNNDRDVPHETSWWWGGVTVLRWPGPWRSLCPAHSVLMGALRLTGLHLWTCWHCRLLYRPH